MVLSPGGSIGVCTCEQNNFACKKRFYSQMFQLFFLDRIQSCSQVPKSKTAEICKTEFLKYFSFFKLSTAVK